MVGWIILGVILLLFVLLFTVHVHLTIDLKDDLALTLRIFGFPIYLRPKKQKKYKLRHYTLKKIRRREAKAAKKQAKSDAKAAKKKAEKAKKKAAESKLTKAQRKALKQKKKASRPAITDMIPLAGSVAKLFFSRFFGKLHIKIARIHVKVGGSDAAMVAISYGMMTNAMGGLVALLQKICDVDSLKKADIWVEPDFESDKIDFDFDITFRMSLGNVLWAAIKAGWKFLVGYMKIKPEAPDNDAASDKKKRSGKKTNGKSHDTQATSEVPDEIKPPNESSKIGGISLPPAPPKPPAPPCPW